MPSRSSYIRELSRRTSCSRPSSRKISSVRVESTCAAGWVGGAARRSTTRVSIPCSASSSAAVAPAGPAPTIRTREVPMSLSGCAEFELQTRSPGAAGVHHLARHQRHQRLRGSIVIALPTRDYRSLYLKLNCPRFYALFLRLESMARTRIDDRNSQFDALNHGVRS